MEFFWAFVGALVAAIGSYLSARTNSAGKRENQLLDQLQEEVCRQGESLIALRQEVFLMETFSREQAEYIYALRAHIFAKLPPPPPEPPSSFNKKFS